MTPAQEKAVGDWLAASLTCPRCPACGHAGPPWWALYKDLFAVPAAVKHGASVVPRPEHGLTLAAVHCRSCHHTLFFNVKHLPLP